MALEIRKLVTLGMGEESSGVLVIFCYLVMVTQCVHFVTIIPSSHPLMICALCSVYKILQ